MRDYYLFELARIHVVPAAEYHVLFTVDDSQISFLIDDADVAGVKPSVVNAFSVASGRL